MEGALAPAAGCVVVRVVTKACSASSMSACALYSRSCRPTLNTSRSGLNSAFITACHSVEQLRRNGRHAYVSFDEPMRRSCFACFDASRLAASPSSIACITPSLLSSELSS